MEPTSPIPEDFYKKGLQLFDVPVVNDVIKEPFLNFDKEAIPYKSLPEVLLFLEKYVRGELPSWLSKTTAIEPGTAYCCKQSEMSTTPRHYVHRSAVPKTLVCHDYKGGYLGDRFVNYNWEGEGEYIFTQWNMIDTFVYFSHNLVTVPPPCWINAGHAHGVRVLGTLISEGDSGSQFWEDVLATEDKWKWFADALCIISRAHRFDGYLLNVENMIRSDNVPKLVEFVQHLKKRLPKTSLLIWYDSVIDSGFLSWQNALNQRNVEFFKACDGIFLNYCYNDWQLHRSGALAAERHFDVYVGIDVFGRGCPGQGFCASDAAAMARKHNLSIAIFAPGWTTEVAPSDPILNNKIFWSSLREYLFIHGTKSNLAVPKYLVGGKKIGLKNFNQYTQAVGDDCFLWTGPAGSVALSFVTPSPDVAREHRAILELQDAVVTYRERDITKYYSDFPNPLMGVIETNIEDENKTLVVDTRGQITASKIAMMFFEADLRTGVRITIRSKGFDNYSGSLWGYVTSLDNDDIVNTKFDIETNNSWTSLSKDLQLAGKLLEVGVGASPNALAYISQVLVQQM